MILSHILADIDEKQKIINDFRPFGPTYLAQIINFYKVATVWSSNAIEGFSYTESETKVLIEDGLTAGGKPISDAFAVIGHAKAYDHMFTLLNQRKLKEQDVLLYHSLLQGSLTKEAAPGEYRKIKIFVSGSNHSFPGPDEVPAEMNRFFESAGNKPNDLHTVAFAAQIHKDLVTIHPFADGNGRVARLAMNTVLIQDGYLPIAIPPILRTEYINCLETSNSGNDRPFVEFICGCQRETQKDFIRMLGAPKPKADQSASAPPPAQASETPKEAKKKRMKL
jgi:Fic family protein